MRLTMTATRPADFTRPGTAILARMPQHDATALTQGGNQALIVLDEQVYQLRITRADKLILTK
ncbi:MAG: hemin uptake protein HemP [Paracoccus marcusii]